MPKLGITQIMQLANDKFIGFHRDAARAAKSINIPGFDTITVKYEGDIQSLDYYTNGQKAAMALGESANAKKVRDQAFMQFRSCVKLWSTDADQGYQALGKAIWGYFKNFTRIDHVRSDVVTQKIEKTLPLIRDLVASEQYAPVYSGSAIEESFNQLEKAEAHYTSANAKLAEVQSKREQQSNIDLRDSCMDKFFKIKVAAEIIAEYRGDEECIRFLEEIMSIAQKYCNTKAA